MATFNLYVLVALDVHHVRHTVLCIERRSCDVSFGGQISINNNCTVSAISKHPHRVSGSHKTPLTFWGC